MQDSLWLTGGSGGVQNEQRVLAVEVLGIVGGGLAAHEFVPPDILVGPHDLASGPAHNQDVFDGWRVRDCLIDSGFQRERSPAPVATIGGDD